MEIEWRRDGSRLLIPIQILRPSPAADLSSFDATALLDTGATASGVARHVAEQMALPSIGKEPINTAGGNMSEGYIHGMNHVIEAVRQVRGQASNQVVGAELAFVSSGPLPVGGGTVIRSDA